MVKVLLLVLCLEIIWVFLFLFFLSFPFFPLFPIVEEGTGGIWDSGSDSGTERSRQGLVASAKRSKEMMMGIKRSSREGGGRRGRGRQRHGVVSGEQMERSGPRWDAGERLATITGPAVEREATSRTLAFGGE